MITVCIACLAGGFLAGSLISAYVMCCMLEDSKEDNEVDNEEQ